MGLHAARIVIAFVALFLVPAQAMYGPHSQVAVLNPSNFKSTVLDSDQMWLVEFYAPWCAT